MTVSAGGVVSVSVGVVVVVAGARSADLPFPPKNVVSRPPPDAELPATSSGTVMITAATRKPSSPVRIAGLQLRRRGTTELPRISPCCGDALGGEPQTVAGRCGRLTPPGVVLRTTPRTGTARVTTTSAGRDEQLLQQRHERPA